MNYNNYLKTKQAFMNLKINNEYYQQGGDSKFGISSGSIVNEKFVSNNYIKKNENTSPHILFDNIPKGTKKIVLIMYDPDAKPFTGKIFIHWFLTLSPKVKEIAEANTTMEGKALKNDFNKRRYDGPDPPEDSGQHKYYITAYAIDTKKIKFGKETFESMLNKIDGHEVGRTSIIVRYPNL